VADGPAPLRVQVVQNDHDTPLGRIGVAPATPAPPIRSISDDHRRRDIDLHCADA
jgi:hypothetical protein